MTAPLTPPAEPPPDYTGPPIPMRTFLQAMTHPAHAHHLYALRASLGDRPTMTDHDEHEADRTRERTARAKLPPGAGQLPPIAGEQEVFALLADVRLWQVVIVSCELATCEDFPDPASLDALVREQLARDAQEAWALACPDPVDLRKVVAERMDIVMARVFTARATGPGLDLPELGAVASRLEDIGISLAPPPGAHPPADMRSARQAYLSRATDPTSTLLEVFLAETLTPGWPFLDLVDIGQGGRIRDRQAAVEPADRERDTFDVEGYTPIEDLPRADAWAHVPAVEPPHRDAPPTGLHASVKARAFAGHLATIEERGWALASCDLPGVGRILHTLGLPSRFGVAELAVAGLPPASAYPLLSALTAATRQELEHGQFPAGRFAPFPLRLVAAHPAWLGHPALALIVEVAAELELVEAPGLRQVVLPDPGGRWPGQEGYALGGTLLSDPPAT